MLQPPSWPNIGVFNLHFFVFLKENIDVEKKQNLKSGKIAEIRKGDLKEKEERKPPKREKGLMKKQLCDWIIWWCSFHETEANEKQKEKTRQN